MFKDLWVVLYLFEHRANAEIIRALLNKVKNLSRQRQLLLLPCIVYGISHIATFFKTTPINMWNASYMSFASLVMRHT
jgi:hypothetical protein